VDFRHFFQALKREGRIKPGMTQRVAAESIPGNTRADPESV
jgi:hypothetical protein